MNDLDKILEVYRDTFGVKDDRANEIHRSACEEVARLRQVPKDDLWALVDYVQVDLHNGIQVAPGWDETLDRVRAWLG